MCYVLASSPFFSPFLILLSHGPAFTTEHDLHPIAVSISLHLLSFSLPTFTDDTAQYIGPIYLKCLFFNYFSLLLPHPTYTAPPLTATLSSRKSSCVPGHWHLPTSHGTLGWHTPVGADTTWQKAEEHIHSDYQSGACAVDKCDKLLVSNDFVKMERIDSPMMLSMVLMCITSFTCFDKTISAIQNRGYRG
ncbi:hypothetical protein K439DRAFT_1616889 [Ramaria rubella]|nr:hypothetical protein K439DRAFT_1616889 [Ramaria rubella]